MLYITPQQLIQYYDSRRVLQLASDSDEDASLMDLSSPVSPAFQIVNNCITVACSEIDTHCQIGRIYTRQQLEQIITDANDSPNDIVKQKRVGLLRQLTADLAFGLLVSRRGYSAETLREMAPRYEAALNTLERLAAGMQVFDLEDQLQRQVPARVAIGARAGMTDGNRLFGVWHNQQFRLWRT